MKKGSPVLIIPTDSCISRTPHLVGKIGIVEQAPTHPCTWYKVNFSDIGQTHTFRPSALRQMKEGTTENDIKEIIPIHLQNSVAYYESAFPSAKSSLTIKSPKLKKESRKSLKRKINKNRNTNFEYIERSEIDYNMFKDKSGFGMPIYIQDETSLTDDGDDDDDGDDADNEVEDNYMGTSNSHSKYLMQRLERKNNIQISASCKNKYKMTNLKENTSSSQSCSVCQNAKWPGGKFCWYECCPSSPIYYKMSESVSPSNNEVTSDNNRSRSESFNFLTFSENQLINADTDSVKEYSNSYKSNEINHEKFQLDENGLVERREESNDKMNIDPLSNITQLLNYADNLSPDNLAIYESHLALVETSVDAALLLPIIAKRARSESMSSVASNEIDGTMRASLVINEMSTITVPISLLASPRQRTDSEITDIELNDSPSFLIGVKSQPLLPISIENSNHNDCI